MVVDNEAEDDGVIVTVPVEDTEVVEDVTLAVVPEEVDEVDITVMVVEYGNNVPSPLPSDSVALVLLLLDITA